MSLSKSIVVVNQFSVRGPDGSGSRGSTPGLYVERYIVDDDKNEPLWPIGGEDVRETSARYEALSRSVMEASTFGVATRRAARSRDGMAFSRDSVSMSFDDAKALARRIQSAFEAGKTVMKTVVTFEDEYLEEMGVVERGTSTGLRGAHRGHVDQLRLRHALQRGMGRMSLGFDDLVWVASLHLDKVHAHMHVAAVDMGRGRVRYDGQQRGVLGRRDVSRLRHGIDDALQESLRLRPFVRSAQIENVRVANTVRGYVYDAIDRRGVPQLIMAALPDDKSLWRVGTGAREMERADLLARDYVGGILAEPDSGFAEAVDEIRVRAETRGADKGLSAGERAQLALRGRKVLEDSCVNAVYDTLSKVDDASRVVTSPFLDVFSAGLGDLASRASHDDVADFGLRVRSYGSRLEHHKTERRRFRQAEESYLSTDSPAEESRPVYEFFAFERLYQEMLMAKYQYFMAFLPSEYDWRERVREVLGYRVSSERLDHLLADDGFRGLRGDDAEAFARGRYGVRGGAAYAADRYLLEDDAMAARREFEEAEADLAFDVAEDAMRLDWQGSGRRVSLALRHEPLHAFDDVKALDLHHLAYDFEGETEVSLPNVRSFVRAAVRRKELMDDAIDYFRLTGQSSVIGSLPVADVDAMYDFARRLSSSGSLPSSRTGGGSVPHVRTIGISEKFEEDTRERVLGELRLNRGIELVERELNM